MMMRALHFVLGVVRPGLLLGAGLLLVILPIGLFTVQGMPAWPWALDMVLAHKDLVIVAGSGIIIVEVLYWLTAPRRRRPASSITRRNKAGGISLDLNTVRDSLRDLAEEYDEVLRLEPEVFARGTAMDIELALEVVRGSNVPDLCESLQDRVRALVADQVGVFRVHQIRVVIEKLVRADPAAPDETRNDEANAAADDSEAPTRVWQENTAADGKTTP